MAIVYVIKHSPDSSIGSTASWLRLNSFEYRIIDASNTLNWPILQSADRLIIMGGDIEVWETTKYKWLVAEKEFVRTAVANCKGVLGICLGAQIIAECLGSKIRSSDVWQVGWHDVDILGSKKRSLTAFQYHSSTFTLPRKAVRIATSSLVAEQGFQIGSRILGFQFHPEIDTLRLCKIAANWSPKYRGQVSGLLTTIFKSAFYMRPLRTFYFEQLNHWAKI